MTQRTAKIIGAIGRTLIALGLLVILFAGFQLYGTGILEAQAQEELESEFDDKLDELEAAGLIVTDPAELGATDDAMPDESGSDESGSDESGSDENAIDDAVSDFDQPRLGDPDGPEFVVSDFEPDSLTPVQIALLTPQEGEVLGKIEIPRIGLERQLIEGVRRDDLRKGPGHYEDTPLPGQPGNAAIAGHRTTYGEPFGDLDLLAPGDLVKVTTLQGDHFYEVMPQIDEDGNESGHFIVHPSETEVLQDFGDNRLTLTACHPKRSSRLRIIVTARLVSAPSAVVPELSDEVLAEIRNEESVEEVAIDEATAIDEETTVGVDDNALEASLGWNLEERRPTILWGLAALAVAVAAIVSSKYIKSWLAYLIAAPPFLLLLFFCFVHLDRLLPAL